MSIDQLEETALAMVAPGKGIIAIDESFNTIGKRFAAVGVESTEENRRAYREMLLTTPNLNQHISGAILYDETIRQSTKDGVPFPKYMSENGIIPGIKVDTGAKDMALHAGEKITEGLDGLRDRLQEYAKLGAQFAKWRAVITIGEGTPSEACVHANCHALARYAALCQEAGIVPMVEPEVLMDGTHSLADSYSITHGVLRMLFNALSDQDIIMEGTILKASMVISGKDSGEEFDASDVADATVHCLKSAVPATLPGIVFLSGGQSDEQATAHLNAMNKYDNLPWPLSFSYGRAMQQAALKLWAADMTGNYAQAQQTVFDRARANGLAALGEYEG